MTRLVASKSKVRSAGGWEEYLRDQYGLLEGVELKRIKDEGSYGNRTFIFDAPEGEIRCSGYISGGLVPTYKMSVYNEEQRKALFGFGDYARMKRLKAEATTGLND